MTLVEQLVRHYSPSGWEDEAAACLLDEMAERGFRTERDAVGNAVGTVGSGPRRVDLIGHIDTVPGELPVESTNGTLHGRGSVDAKGPLAAFVAAASAFVGSTDLAIRVIGCVGEEADSRGARHVLESYEPPDAVVIGEPSGTDGITLGYKGAIGFHYALEIPRAHQGAEMPTAAEAAVAFYSVLRAAYPDGGTGFDVPSIRLIGIGSGNDRSYEQAELTLGVRTPPAFDIDAFKAEAARLANGAQLTWGEYTPPVLAAKRTPLVGALSGAIRSEGLTPRFVRKTGTSDMNLLQSWNVPIVAYGPGDSRLDHTPEEHLILEDYERAIRILQRALGSLPARLARGERS
ncbi:MAG: [LysW]-lysine hydrolase [Candidatus Bipolaricaulia bacterium]